MARQLHGLRIETIKPASLTPSHLKRFNLSPTDQVTPRIYMPIVFYYPNHVPRSLKDIADKSSQLKSSLSEILTHYYPFAGRLNCGAYVDCNDEGVEFQEANIKCGLSEILKKPQNEAVDLVFPSGLAWLGVRWRNVQVCWSFGLQISNVEDCQLRFVTANNTDDGNFDTSSMLKTVDLNRFECDSKKICLKKNAKSQNRHFLGTHELKNKTLKVDRQIQRKSSQKSHSSLSLSVCRARPTSAATSSPRITRHSAVV
ncbi:hypothetical protein LguiB_005508 [Lonicera macranthoides]